MEVELHTFGPLREAVGEKELSIEVPGGATVRDALAAAEESHPGLSGRLLDGDDLAEGVTLTHEGTAIEHRNGLDTGLSEGDVLRATPPIVGG